MSGTCGLICAAEAVRVDLVAFGEAAQALDLAGQRIELLCNSCQRRCLRVHARREGHLHGTALELQHQLLRPGQLRLHELELVVGQLRVTGSDFSSLSGPSLDMRSKL